MATSAHLSSYSPDTCLLCTNPLCIPSDEHDDGPSHVTDDVELYCGPPGSGPGGHHTHWSCFLEWAKENDPTRCPLCDQNIMDATGRLIVNVNNEGGVTNGFDFGEVIDEERYLEQHPEQELNRAFHDLVAQGLYDDASQLVAEGKVDVDCTYGRDGLRALQKAMLSGDTQGAAFLRGLGAT